MPNITMKNVRISYPHLFAPKQIGGQGDPKYSAAFVIPKNHPQLPELIAMVNAAITLAHPNGTPNGFKQLPLHDGAVKYPGKPEYADSMVLNTSKNPAQGKPSVVDQNMQEVLDPGAVYPGLIVNAALSVYTYNNVSKGVTTGLEAVQIVGGGERLDNKPSVDELFEPIDVPGGATGGGYNPLA